MKMAPKRGHTKPVFRVRNLLLLTALVASAPIHASAQTAASKSLPFVSTIFADNMVLQREKPDAIWGWADPGDKITVEIAGKTATATTGPDRRWQLQIQPPPAGGPYTLTIKGRQTVELHNVLVGDVWLCGVQSNMHVTLANALNGLEEVKAANHSQIRFFDV